MKASTTRMDANAHPGAAVWVPVVALLVLSLAAYYLFWAKLTGSWPFLHDLNLL